MHLQADSTMTRRLPSQADLTELMQEFAVQIGMTPMFKEVDAAPPVQASEFDANLKQIAAAKVDCVFLLFKAVATASSNVALGDNALMRASLLL